MSVLRHLSPGLSHGTDMLCGVRQAKGEPAPEQLAPTTLGFGLSEDGASVRQSREPKGQDQ